jgi:beta-lactamase class A
MNMREGVPAGRGGVPKLLPRAAVALALLGALHLLAFPDATSTATRAAAPAPRAAVSPQWQELATAVERVRGGFRGTLHVYVEDLQTGRTIALDEQAPVPAASLIKLPLAVALLEQRLAGKVSLEDERVLAASDKAAGSGVLRRARSGTSYTVRALLELMLQRSDNTATNMLTDLLGLEQINDSCRRQGLAVTCMPRYIMDLESRDRAIENYTSAADMARAFKALYTRSVLDAPSCDLLLGILKGQQVRDRLPRYLPSGTVVAHKTGLMNDACHDAGILYGANHDYVVAVLASDFPSFTQAKTAIGKIGQLVYRYDRGEALAPPPPRRSPAKRPAAPAAKKTAAVSRKR